jgi:hypothetical protein
VIVHQAFRRQALERPAGQPQVLQDRGHPAKRRGTARLQDGVARAQAQARATSAGARPRRQSTKSRCAGPSLSAVPDRGAAQEAVLHLLLGVRGHEGAAPWRRTSRCPAANSSMALRTVPWLTL